MSAFISIRTKELYTGELPRSVTLTERASMYGRLCTVLVTVDYGDPGWEEALDRWMFLRGYTHPEDNERELARDTQEPPGEPQADNPAE